VNTHFRASLVLVCLIAAIGCQKDPTSPEDSAQPVAAASSTQPAGQSDLRVPARQMADAAKALWDALDPAQRTKASIAFDDPERQNWAYVPKSRKGLPWKELSAPQQQLATAMLRSGLSERGYEKVDQIINVLEPILRDLEGGNAGRDPGLYYFTVFGTPGPEQTWGWRVEGHHVALNFTIIGGKAIASAPAFLGANPATVQDGPRKGLRVLGREEDLGRQLVKSLDETQRRVAIFSDRAPREIITGNSRKISATQPSGIPAAKLTAPQRATLNELVGEYAHRLRGELAEQDLHKIQSAGWDAVYFGWAGDLEPGQGHYYRIQGPTFLIEYDNTQNQANHIHSVWRDPANDFGEDLLRKHYAEHHHDHS
jgi:hypothetical protein